MNGPVPFVPMSEMIKTPSAVDLAIRMLLKTESL